MSYSFWALLHHPYGSYSGHFTQEKTVMFRLHLQMYLGHLYKVCVVLLFTIKLKEMYLLFSTDGSFMQNIMQPSTCWTPCTYAYFPRLSLYPFCCFPPGCVPLSFSRNVFHNTCILVCQFDIYFCCLFSSLIFFLGVVLKSEFFGPWVFVCHTWNVCFSSHFWAFYYCTSILFLMISVSYHSTTKVTKLN